AGGGGRGFGWGAGYGGGVGLNKAATGETRGAISLSSSTHLPPSEGSLVAKPVALPPGRDRLATKPLPTGSATVAKTRGMVRVCWSSIAVVGGLFERMTWGLSATSSLANRSINFASNPAHR